MMKIHCSEAAAKLVMVQDPSLLLIPRGAIPIKGKNKMNTFWVHESNSSKDAGIYIYALDIMQHSLCAISQLSHSFSSDTVARAGPSHSPSLAPLLFIDLTDSK